MVWQSIDVFQRMIILRVRALAGNHSRSVLISMTTASRHMLNNSDCTSTAKLLHRVKLLFPNIGKIVLNKTMKIARSAETATQEAILLSNGTKEDPIQIDHVAHGSKLLSKQYTCYRCGGKDGRNACECGAIYPKCNACKKVGHLQKVCRSMTKTADQNRHKQRERPAKKDKKRGFNKIRSLKSKPWLYDSSNDENEPVLSFRNADSSITVQLIMAKGQGW